MSHEITFSMGTLRQPGVWGKILQPPAHGIFDVDVINQEHMVVKKNETTLQPQHLYDDLLVIFCIKGYLQAGLLTSAYVLLKVKAGAQFEWQFTGHLARVSGKEFELLLQCENNLEPIYEKVKEAGYLDVARVRQTLRNEGKDRG